MKSRVTISLSSKMLEEVDKFVDGEDVTNRSQAIEKILRTYFMPSPARTAFILAGGQGTRLRPLTYELPKPMVPIKGKPILEYAINKLKEADVKEIVISTGYLGKRIKEHFGDGERLGVNIKYVDEDKPLGTGGALKRAERLFRDDVIVLNGDNLFDFDISKMYEFHKKSKSIATLAVTTQTDVSRFGVVEMDGNRVVSFIEKPKNATNSHIVNAGVYVLSPVAISLIQDGTSDLSELFSNLAKKGKLNGFIYSGKWFPCDSLELYERALKNWS